MSPRSAAPLSPRDRDGQGQGAQSLQARGDADGDDCAAGIAGAHHGARAGEQEEEGRAGEQEAEGRAGRLGGFVSIRFVPFTMAWCSVRYGEAALNSIIRLHAVAHEQIDGYFWSTYILDTSIM